MGLGSNANVWNTCLRLLRRQGFDLRVEGHLDEDGSIIPESCLWFAEKDGFSLYGDNPIELLGLAGIFAAVRPEEDVPYWWAVDGPDILDELYEAAFGDHD